VSQRQVPGNNLEGIPHEPEARAKAHIGLRSRFRLVENAYPAVGYKLQNLILAMLNEIEEITMHRRQFITATSCFATASAMAAANGAEPNHEADIRRVIQRYVDAREARDPKDIEPLLTPDADQLVSDGTWRRGRDQLVKGMLGSSRKNPARRTITVESVRLLAPDIALADGRYTQKGSTGGKDRVMWTAIVLKRGADGWSIAAIRNMLPAAAVG
jgi:uncharacterized protein (TIGR02246 family)